MELNYLKGDLIELAKLGTFEVIIHGCNCLCVQGAGLAKQMNAAFGTLDPTKFPLEDMKYRGDMNKLGQIQSYGEYKKLPGTWMDNSTSFFLEIVNCYTQYDYNHGKKPLDYEALTLCMRKLNSKFRDKHIGTGKIGCNLGGGDWNIVESILERELKNCKVTVVEL